MKKAIFTIALAAIGFGAIAQESPYVFPDFVSGTVIQKGGVKATANINYNTITQEMVFTQGATKQVLDAGNVDSVIIQGKKFVPGGKVFYLKLTDTKVPLYQQITNNRSGSANAQVSAGMAPRTMTGSDDAAKPATTSADYDLKLKEGEKLEPDNKFWIEKDGKFEKANDKKDFVKAFPDKEQAIESFIKDNAIDFKKADDVIKLVTFCIK